MRIASIVVVLLLVGCMGSTTQLPQPQGEQIQQEIKIQEQLVARQKIQQGERLFNVGEPILAANTQFCGEYVTKTYGLDILHPSQIKKANVKKALEFGSLAKVLAVAPNMPAALAGIQTNDEVITIDGIDPQDSKMLEERVQQGGAVNVGLIRNGERMDVAIQDSALKCSFPYYLETNDTVNAWTDGEGIYFTTGIMRYLHNDRDLAAVFGHELAHITMEHVDKKQTQAAVGAVLGAVLSATLGVDVTDLGANLGAGAYSQEYEAEADYVGAYYTARAGWNIDELPDVWRQMAIGHPQAIHSTGGTHPSSAYRFVALEKTVAEIKQKQAQGLELVPNARE